MSKIAGIGILIFAGYAGMLSAATHYVAPTGRDDEPGSSGDPWLTISNGAAHALAAVAGWASRQKITCIPAVNVILFKRYRKRLR